MSLRMMALIAVPAALSASVACADLSEDVSTDVCVSGKRWTGGDLGSPEMHPGGDCVTCHRENDGPPLMFGGTVYATPKGIDPTQAQGSPLGPGDQEDCYGVEGVKVTVTTNMGMGKAYETVTNEAGNFFMEGDENELFGVDAMGNPIGYKVRIKFEDSPEREMFTLPNTGNCASCHNPSRLPPTPNPVPLFPTDRIDLGLPPPTAASTAPAASAPPAM